MWRRGYTAAFFFFGLKKALSLDMPRVSTLSIRAFFGAASAILSSCGAINQGHA